MKPISRVPIPGVLPPNAVARISPEPPIDPDTETALVFTHSEGRVVKVSSDPNDLGVVIITNLSPTFSPYILAIVRRDAHSAVTKVGDVYSYIKGWLAERKAPSNP